MLELPIEVKLSVKPNLVIEIRFNSISPITLIHLILRIWFMEDSLMGLNSLFYAKML